jgi:hypothetical protein
MVAPLSSIRRRTRSSSMRIAAMKAPIGRKARKPGSNTSQPAICTSPSTPRCECREMNPSAPQSRHSSPPLSRPTIAEDGMTGWKMTMIEPTLDDLLADEIMQPIMRSAGVDAAQLRAGLGETARRLIERDVALPPPTHRSGLLHSASCST